MGTVTGIGDLDPNRWPGSKWRNLEVCKEWVGLWKMLTFLQTSFFQVVLDVQIWLSGWMG